MPASKSDLQSIHGRLRDARARRGLTRKDFAQLVGYSMHGWAKIELGTNALSAEMLKKANAILGLDERYYFGKLSYDDAQKSRISTVEQIERELVQLSSVPLHPNVIGGRALTNPFFRELLGRLDRLSEERLQRMCDRIAGYLDGVEDADLEPRGKEGQLRQG